MTTQGGQVVDFGVLVSRRGLDGFGLAVALRARGLSVHPTTTSTWIEGKFRPGLDYVPELCELLNVTPFELKGACGASVAAYREAQSALRASRAAEKPVARRAGAR